MTFRTLPPYNPDMVISPRGPILSQVLLLTVLFCPSGCATQELKPSEDALWFRRIDSFVEELRAAYQDKNKSLFFSHYPADLLEDRQFISQEVFAKADALRLDFSIDRILIQDEKIMVQLHWELRWRLATTERRERGNATFKLIGKNLIHLVSIEGDNPFVAPILLVIDSGPPAEKSP